MNLFKIRNFRGGKSDWADVGILGSFKFGSNLNIRRDVDSITCNQALTDDLATGTMTATANFIVNSSDGNSYFFCADGKIFKRTSAGAYTLVYTDAGGAILGAIEWGQDNGKNYLFWATDTHLHSKEIAGLANWSDVDASIGTTTYPKTITSAPWHIMKQINGTMLFGNGSWLGMVSWDKSYTDKSLALTPNNIAKPLMEYKGYAYIGTTKADNAQNAEMYVWDTAQSLNWNAKNTVPTNAINAMINSEYPLMQVGVNGQLLLADISTYTLPLVSFGDGGIVKPDAVEIVDGVAMFGVYGNGTGKSGIWSYGRKKKNANISLNLEYAFDCTEIGSIKQVGTDLLLSYKTTTTGSVYGVKKVDLSNKAIGTYQSLDLVLPSTLTALSKIRATYSDREQVITKIRIITAPLPAGTSITCKRRIDKSGNFVTANLEGGGSSMTGTGMQDAWFYVGDMAKIVEVELTLTPYQNVAPEVYEIQLYFE